MCKQKTNKQKKPKKNHSTAIYGAMGEGDEDEQGAHQFILIWIMAQQCNAIKWEWLFSKGVLRSLQEP